MVGQGGPGLKIYKRIITKAQQNRTCAEKENREEKKKRPGIE